MAYSRPEVVSNLENKNKNSAENSPQKVGTVFSWVESSLSFFLFYLKIPPGPIWGRIALWVDLLFVCPFNQGRKIVVSQFLRLSKEKKATPVHVPNLDPPPASLLQTAATRGPMSNWNFWGNFWQMMQQTSALHVPLRLSCLGQKKFS